MDGANAQLFGLPVSEGSHIKLAQKEEVNGVFPAKCEFVYYQKSLFGCGGENADSTWNAAAFEIDLNKAPLQAVVREPLPSGRTGHCLVVVNSSIYSIGGTTIDPIENVDIYSHNAWTPGPNLLQGLKEPAAVFIEKNQSLYVFGGRTATELATDVLVLNIASGATDWEILPVLSLPVQDQLYMYVAAPYNDGVMLFGGFNSQECFFYDLTANALSPIPGLQFPDAKRIKTSTIYAFKEEIYAFCPNDSQLYSFANGKWKATPTSDWCGEAIIQDLTVYVAAPKKY